MRCPKSLILVATLVALPHADAARYPVRARHQVQTRVVTKTVAVPTPVPVVDPATSRASVQAQHEAAVNVAAQQEKMNRENSVGADKRVVDHLRQRTEDGSADAPYDLAKRHEEGLGVAKDPAEADRLYRLSAERGNADAQRWVSRQKAVGKSTQ